MQQTIEREKASRGYLELDTMRDLPIKKAMSAYVLFGNEVRGRIASDYPNKGQGLKVTEVVRIIANEWEKLSKQEKSHYKELAKKDRLRFEAELKQLSGS